MATNRNIVEMVEAIRSGAGGASGTGGVDGIYMADVVSVEPLTIKMYDKSITKNIYINPALTLEASNSGEKMRKVFQDSFETQEAYEFLKWYWNKENTLKVAKAAYIMPGRNSAIQDESLATEEDSWDLCQEAVQKNVLPDYVKLPGWGQFTEGVALTLCAEYFAGTIEFDDFISRFEAEGSRILNENK